MSDVVDAEVVEETALAVQTSAPVSLFGTTDPEEVIDTAAKHATALARVINDKGLYSRIQGRDHVQVEGWQLLGSMTGVFAVVTKSTPITDSQGEAGWEAHCEARTMDGRVVGAADAMCTRSERTWKSRDDYAIRSMAQTRATSKALKGPLGFIVKLAGYSATPAEEMTFSDPQTVSHPTSSPSEPAGSAATPVEPKEEPVSRDSGSSSPPQTATWFEPLVAQYGASEFCKIATKLSTKGAVVTDPAQTEGATKEQRDAISKALADSDWGAPAPAGAAK